MQHQILSFGEALWDIFPDYRKPGGSPANVAYHLHCLGNRTKLLSRIGPDKEGRELIHFLKEKGLPVDFIQQDDSLPTGRVTVHFKENEPGYTIHEPSAWDAIEATSDVIGLAGKLDAVCFASLSQRNDQSASALDEILESVSDSCLTVFDLNLRPPFVDSRRILKMMDRSDVIKFNEDEFEVVKRWYGKEDFASNLIKNDPRKILLITKGEAGSTLISASGTYSEPAYPISGEGDFVGVGDAFLAAFIHLKLNGEPAGGILKPANRYASFVASKEGAMPEIPEEILKLYKS